MRGTYAFTFLRNADFLARTKEEQTKFIELQIALRHKKVVMKERIANVNSIDDFLNPLLSGHILKEFSNINSNKHFKHKGLPVNFPGGH